MDAAAGVRVRVFLAELAGDQIHLGPRRFESYAGLEPRDRAQMPAAPVVFVRRFRDRTIKFRGPAQQSNRQRLEIRRHHADYRVIASAELDRFADDVRIAREPSLPEPVTKDNDEVLPLRLFFCRENAAEQWLAMHDCEK